MILYHGSTKIVEKPEIRISNRFLDFGNGFYTTTSEEQAIAWAKSKSERLHTENAYINIYELDDYVLSDKKFSVLIFERPTREWLDFVIANRRGELQHNYDFVMGAVADDTLYQTFTLYESGLLTLEETIIRLNTHTLFDQLSFNTEKALNNLKYVKTELH
ncbi:MAG: DUF3990 domain-containing protein [Dysgonamonadaceae bacterium]|jgi:hypothetical protein|nr:DUF3990 domain-containing protein [Dysgonamonadaceae bacterium]